MRRAFGSAALAATLVTAPASAATIVLLPAPGSMSAPRILFDGSDSDDVYICTAPTDLRGGSCSLQKSPVPRRRR